MRVTIDRDSLGWLDVVITVARGLWHIGRWPDKIVRSAGGHGRHYVWHDAAHSFQESVRLRRAIGDDARRINHDLLRKKKEFRQVLFTKKTIEKVTIHEDGRTAG
jgi:hypothetical protein